MCFTKYLFVVLSIVAKYVLLVLTVSDISSLCKETFNATLQENLDVIKRYPRGEADKYLFKIGNNRTEPSEVRDFPVFVTAFDRMYYPQSQGLFYTLHKKFLTTKRYASKFKLIVYDMGMSVRQLKMVCIKHLL